MTWIERTARDAARSALEELEERELQSTDYAERLQLLIAQSQLRGQLALVEALDVVVDKLDTLNEMTELVARGDDE